MAQSLNAAMQKVHMPFWLIGVSFALPKRAVGARAALQFGRYMASKGANAQSAGAGSGGAATTG